MNNCQADAAQVCLANAATSSSPGSPDGPLPRWRILLLTLVLFPLLAFVVVYGILQACRPPAAPADVLPGAPLGPRIAERVAFIVVDGLRYDVATDPNRMPHFARAMQRHLSGEIWAGPVSMTSSAVMAYGTGQRGGLEQVIRNLHAEPARQNTWLANAHQQGLSLMTVGELAWSQVYSQWLRAYRHDPEGVAIDVDFNPETFAAARELMEKRPDFLVLHFVTPDHQGHAYRVTSQRYADHIRDFDAKLSVLVSELGPSWTVIVTSDHGAADSGTHGTDTLIQRRSPIYAYGPGIVRGAPGSQSVDQLDLSVTLPILLGVAPPAHGLGRALVSWLDLPEERRAELACENAKRVAAYAERVQPGSQPLQQALQPCAQQNTPAQRIAAADRTVGIADRMVSLSTGLKSSGALRWMIVIGLLGAATLLVMVPWIGLGPLLAALSLFGVTIGLVAQVERFPGIWPNVIRAILFVLGNSVLLALLIRPKSVVALFERHLRYAAILPMALAASYPANTRPESIVVVIVVGLLYTWLARWQVEGAKGGAPSQKPARLDGLWFGVAILALLPVAMRENATYSSVFSSDLLRRVAVSAIVAVFVWGILRHVKAARWLTVSLVALALLPIWLRPHVGPWLGRGAWLCCAGISIWCFATARSPWAILFGLNSVSWVARDFEVFPLVACVSAALLVGARLAKRGTELGGADLLLGSVFGFALMFALRVGLQDGLEFAGIDWGAAGFNDRSVSATLVGVALVYKYGAGAWLIALGLTARLAALSQRRLLVGLSLCMLTRVLALSGMFFGAGNSFWTALRVLGDLPTALAMSLGCLLLLAPAGLMSKPQATA